MRIALIARGCRPGAGIELYTHELANRLSGRHEVTVLTNPREVTGCQSAIVPISIPPRPLWHSILAFSTKAGFVAQHQQYDIVHTQGSDGRWGDIVTAHSCHLAGMRASLKLNPAFMNKLRKWFSPAHRVVLALERSAFSSARLIIAVSKQVRRQIKAAYPFTRQIPIQVIYPGVDIQTFSCARLASTRTAGRKQFRFDHDHIVFVLVANSPVLKGAERLIRALAVLANAKAQLVIASSSGRQPGLRRLAKQLGVSDRVHIVAARQNAVSVYALGDVYIALPEYESFGLTVLEAMACGLPVILTRNAGVTELLTPGKEGFLLPGRVDSKTVAQAMDYLIQDDEVRKAMGQAARLTAEKYTWERTVRQIEKVYEQILEKKKSEQAL